MWITFLGLGHKEEHQTLQNFDNLLTHLSSIDLSFQPIDEAENLASALSNLFDDPNQIGIGLRELMINAVEHGKLGVTYSEKKDLILSGQYDDEIHNRLNSRDYAHKKAKITVTKFENTIEIIVSDEGQGFDWHKYIEISEDRIFDPHGRGIAMAKAISFDELTYNPSGNSVSVVVKR